MPIDSAVFKILGGVGISVFPGVVGVDGSGATGVTGLAVSVGGAGVVCLSVVVVWVSLPLHPARVRVANESAAKDRGCFNLSSALMPEIEEFTSIYQNNFGLSRQCEFGKGSGSRSRYGLRVKKLAGLPR